MTTEPSASTEQAHEGLRIVSAARPSRSTKLLVAALALLAAFLGAVAPASAQDPDPDLQPRFAPPKPERTKILDGYSERRAHLKLDQGTQVRLRGGKLVSLADDDLSELHTVLNEHPGVVPSRLFKGRPESELAREKERAERRSGREQGDKNLWFRLDVPASTNAQRLIDDLNAAEIVEIAYPEPLPAPPPQVETPNFQPRQGYRGQEPGGIGADATTAMSGGRGQHVQIVDIEAGFNLHHEDLPRADCWSIGPCDLNHDHGTATLGVLFGVDNSFGVRGIADLAHPVVITNSGRTTEHAIDIATQISSPGDVILLEVQVQGPNGEGRWVPIEYIPAVYDAVVAATAQGIIVVAAAGNGSEDLDAPEYDDTFGRRPDSGAIIVGAGAAGTNPPGAHPSIEPNCRGPARGRLPFSNYGPRVDVQGWGECVMTSGYGDALPGGLGIFRGFSGDDNSYTSGYAGTSSASAIVAGAAAVLSSIAIGHANPNGLSSTEVRSILKETGTPQDTSAEALDGNIGPLPSLRAAAHRAASSHISFTARADRPRVAAGELLTYTITTTNHGPTVATDVGVTIQLPAEVTFVSSSVSCELEPPGDLRCPLGDLARGASIELEIEVRVRPDVVFDAEGLVVITNTASVTATTEVTNRTNASVESTVVAAADLEVVSAEALGVPTEALIGEDVPVGVRSTVENHGPSSPIDAEVEITATASPGLSVASAAVMSAVEALEADAPREVEESFAIRCDEPGPQEVVFEVEIRPVNPEDTDPNPENDRRQAVATVDCVVPIAINIRPGNSYNQINLGSNGVVPVAALRTEAGEYELPVDFDATLIEPESVRFGQRELVWEETGGALAHRGDARVKDSHELDDKTKDGDDDIVMGFRTSETGLEPGDDEACMKGRYRAGDEHVSFFGCDVVRTRPETGWDLSLEFSMFVLDSLL